jgi:hypothetical protein
MAPDFVRSVIRRSHVRDAADSALRVHSWTAHLLSRAQWLRLEELACSVERVRRGWVVSVKETYRKMAANCTRSVICRSLVRDAAKAAKRAHFWVDQLLQCLKQKQAPPMSIERIVQLKSQIKKCLLWPQQIRVNTTPHKLVQRVWVPLSTILHRRVFRLRLAPGR